VSFLIVQPENPDSGGAAASAFLLAGGLLSVPVLLALYGVLRERDPQLALLGAVLGVAGALGAAIHGAYDLANAINPPHAALDLPNQVDPRGVLTFGFGGLALLVIAPLMRRLAPVAAELGVVLVALYVLRLTALDGAAVKALAAVAGFALSPLWYAQLSGYLWRSGAPRRRRLRAVA
jgi:hypothetical protein